MNVLAIWKRKEYFELNENKDTIYQNLWASAKVVLRKLMPVRRKDQTSNRSFHLKKLENEDGVWGDANVPILDYGDGSPTL